MNTLLTRRDFLKLAGLLSLSYATPQSYFDLTATPETKENVLIIVFDAWSASNISLLGYGRKTTPYLERLAEKAIVYHNHYAGGHYTTPGTASLLTDTTPWTHQAFTFNGTIDESILHRNIFRPFQQYHRLAYTHNPLANTLLRQFITDINDFTPWEHLYLENDPLINTLFKNDYDVASISWNRAMKRLEEGYAYSLFLSQIYEGYKKRRVEEILPEFPRGIPNYDGLAFFSLKEAIDWLSWLIGSAPQPFMGYFHFLPPHDPYHAQIDYYDVFAEDGYHPQKKAHHILRGDYSDTTINQQRRWYDEYILNVDMEFARLYSFLEQRGVLNNTWLILTSDHGEMFERGILAHNQPVYHRPVINIPLVIFPPHQQTRIDIHDRTSVIDLLPTLLKVTGQDIPEWAEGVVLPPFSEQTAETQQDVTTIHVQERDGNGIIIAATALLVRGNYKLMWYFGYEQLDGEEYIELFDIASDPEEINNLYPHKKDTADEFLGILASKLELLNQVHQ